MSSERAGSGKSLVVRRLSESLLEIANNSVVTSYLRDMEADVPMCISVPIYGPTVDQCAVVESLLPHVIVPDLPLSRIFHLDVHPSVIIVTVLINKNNFFTGSEYISRFNVCQSRVRTVLKSPLILGEVLEKSLNSIFP